MKTLQTILIVIASAGISGTTGYFVAKKKYEKKADEEIESVKKAFNEHLNELTKAGEKIDIPMTRNGYSKYSKKKLSEKKTNKESDREPLPTDPVAVDNYIDYSAPYRTSSKNVKTEKKFVEGEKGATSNDEPYIISPDDFMASSYESSTLLYYADGVLADDDNNVISSYIGLIGPKALNSFGQYQEDTVFVRNDKLKTDFEIILDTREFSKIRRENNPKQSLQDGETYE